jgi:hypothetical protein
MHASACNFLLLFLLITIISAKFFCENVHVWIMNMNEFREILPKQTKFRMEMEQDIFVSTLLQPNIRLVSRVTPFKKSRQTIVKLFPG